MASRYRARRGSRRHFFDPGERRVEDGDDFEIVTFVGGG
jgi:hypothetical protein